MLNNKMILNMEPQNNTTNFFLSWSISSKEKRERIQKMLLIMTTPLIIGYIYYVFFVSENHNIFLDYELDNVFLAIVGIIISVFVFFLINKIFPYAERSYSIDNLGINITKGKKNKKYLWEEFEYYYSYSERGRMSAKVGGNIDNRIYEGQSFRDTIFKTEKNIAGDIFYLKKKKINFISKIYKKFVVVYGKAENSSRISKILSHYLPRKKMNSTSDLGLVFYEFK